METITSIELPAWLCAPPDATPLTAADYVRAGLALVPIPLGQKGPRARSWNREENAIRNETAAAQLNGCNIGLAHRWSGTCAIDVDRYDVAEPWLREHEIDLRALLDAPDAVQIVSGREGRAKLIFRLPGGVEGLPSIKLCPYTDVDGAQHHGLELRCATADGSATVQDVLPPSIHPDTGKPYEWRGDWRKIPVIPEVFLALWRSLEPLEHDTKGNGKGGPLELDLAALAKVSDTWPHIPGALACIPADCSFDEWFRVGMAIHWAASALARLEDGFVLWDTWSKGPPDKPASKYPGERDVRQKWANFHADKAGGITLGTLFQIAGRYGWERPPPDVSGLFGDVRGESKTYGKGFRLTRVSELLRTPEPLCYLIDGYLLPRSTSGMFGGPTVGKSLMAIDWSACIATGRPWNGHATTQGPVIYIAGEGHFGIKRRVKAWAHHHKCEPELAAAPLFVSDTGAALTERSSVAEVFAAVDAIAGDNGKPVLVVIDTLHRNMGPGDENSAQDIGALFRSLDQIRERYGCAVLVVHHSGHVAKDRARGSSSIQAALDIEFALTTTVPGGSRSLSCTKMKDGPEPAPQAFELREITLPWNKANGDPETSVVLKPVRNTSRTEGKPTPRSVDLALQSFFEAGRGSPVNIESWRPIYYARHTGDNQDAKRKAFGRARDELCKLGALTVCDDVYSVGSAVPWNDWHLKLFQYRAKYDGVK